MKPPPAKRKREASQSSDPQSRKDAARDKRPRTTSSSPAAAEGSISQRKQAVANPPTTALSPIHEGLLAEFKPRYNILPAFTISSTKIQKRVTYVLNHLQTDTGDPRPRIMLLHARPPDVCKTITIVETVKRLLADRPTTDEKKGTTGTWYQYNQLYAIPRPIPKREKQQMEVVEDTVLEPPAEEDDEDDHFEVMDLPAREKEEQMKRFGDAVDPGPRERLHMSLSIWLSTVPIAELAARADVTLQADEEKTEAALS